ncbi:hypothetical protein C495_05748 [Natronorubrum sulfidifaciens JCM 14089]|uniref:Uncharacterized protein n=1 Tax=Natronorubrum sulfidifaciens JCM 14089 TaxID=1230460 RepID=L9WBE8_9EURY|nr:hypothetical protein C495_05748 [Natronorubrum sulfidifaciens JCM 14089]
MAQTVGQHYSKIDHAPAAVTLGDVRRTAAFCWASQPTGLLNGREFETDFLLTAVRQYHSFVTIQ